MDLLRAHFRAEEVFVNKAPTNIEFQLPFWRNRYCNGAGDLEAISEILIEYPVAEEMERLFGSDREN